jgi:hypothetical protein
MHGNDGMCARMLLRAGLGCCGTKGSPPRPFLHPHSCAQLLRPARMTPSTRRLQPYVRHWCQSAASSEAASTYEQPALHRTATSDSQQQPPQAGRSQQQAGDSGGGGGGLVIRVGPVEVLEEGPLSACAPFMDAGEGEDG